MPTSTAELRSAILASATKVFSNHGFAGVTMAQLADACGLPERDVAAHFASPAEVLVATLTSRDDDAGQQVQIFDRLGGLDLLQALRHMVAADGSHPERGRLHTKITAEALEPDHPARPWAVQRYRWTRSLFAAALRRDIEAGRIRQTVDPAALATQLIAVMDGLQLQWQLDRDEVEMAASFDDFIAFVTAAITEPAEPNS